VQIWPNLQHTLACCFFSSLSNEFIFSGIAAGVVLLLLVYWLLGLDHPTRILVSRWSVNWSCSQLWCAIGFWNSSMVMLRLDWLVGWDRPLHVELDDIIPGFIWSVSGVNNPRAPCCHCPLGLHVNPSCGFNQILAATFLVELSGLCDSPITYSVWDAHWLKRH